MPPLPRPTPLHLSITPMKQIKIEPDFSTSTPLPPEILSTSTPLPPEILATMKPHPPPPSFSPPSSTCSPSPPLAKPVKPVLPTTTMPALPTVPVPLRMHTKEETEAAHDLLELSRSLPPISGQVANFQTTPPTPPSPPDDNVTSFKLFQMGHSRPLFLSFQAFFKQWKWWVFNFKVFGFCQSGKISPNLDTPISLYIWVL